MIVIFTDPAIGGTFLEWSIHYLAGHSHYYSIHEKTFLPVTETPLTNINAHNFSSNIIADINTATQRIPELINQSSNIQTVYFHYFTEAAPYIKQLLPVISKSIILTTSPEQALYRCHFETRLGADPTPSMINNDTMLTTDTDRFDDFINFFFKQSKTTWEQQQLTNTWDVREFLALNFRPFDTVKITEKIDLAIDHYHIHAMELWDRFDDSVVDLFQYLELDINIKNLKKWTKVYQQWKKIHKDRIFFVWYFDIIIDYVINGYSFDLSRFNLDICQEAAIQHALIYRHNLNLKTWQLEKFTNTRQLHELLEPNRHPLSKY
jgi:hypothetical protein